jgi:hypothetical protein
MNEAGSRTISHTDLPEAGAADMLHEEWNTYRREAARLLAEGVRSNYSAQLQMPRRTRRATSLPSARSGA